MTDPTPGAARSDTRSGYRVISDSLRHDAKKLRLPYLEIAGNCLDDLESQLAAARSEIETLRQQVSNAEEWFAVELRGKRVWRNPRGRLLWRIGAERGTNYSTLWDAISDGLRIRAARAAAEGETDG